jgi:hypothetical protein
VKAEVDSDKVHSNPPAQGPRRADSRGVRTLPSNQLTLKNLLRDYRDAYPTEARVAWAEMTPQQRDDYGYYLKRGNGCGEDDPKEECFAELFAAALATAPDKTTDLASHLPECALIVRRIVRLLSGSALMTVSKGGRTSIFDRY